MTNSLFFRATIIVIVCVSGGSASNACGWLSVETVSDSISSDRESDIGSDSGGSDDSDADIDSDNDADSDTNTDTGIDTDSDGDTSQSAQCVPDRTYSTLWSFDTGMDGWALTQDDPQAGTLAWTDRVGHTDPGSLEATVTLGGYDLSSYLRYNDSSSGDLSGEVITAYVSLDSGSDIWAHIYVLDGEWNWAEGSYVTLTPGTWICLSFDSDAPASAVSGYSPAMIVEVGVHFLGEGDATLLLDDFGF